MTTTAKYLTALDNARVDIIAALNRAGYSVPAGSKYNEIAQYITPRLDMFTFTLNGDESSYSISAASADLMPSKITIPSTYNGLPVTKIATGGFSYCEISTVEFEEGSQLYTIGVSAFMYCSKLEGISLPDSVASIGDAAFAYCDKLATVEVSKTSELDSIGSQAFMECYSLANITNLLANVTGIYQETFQGCSKLPNVTFNPDLDEIGARAFDACYGFTEIHIPANVGIIGEDAFRSCHNVETITVDADNITYHSKNNCLIETATNKLIFGCKNSIVPNNVASIADGAFNGIAIPSIIVPITVVEVGKNVFANAPNTTVYVEAESKPDGWADDWCDDSVTVVWGYTETEDTNTYLITESGDNLTDEAGNLLII